MDGSGTAGKITKWSDSDTITDSIMSESSSTIEIGASTPILKFNNLAGGGLDPSLTASGTNFTISTSSLTPLSIALDTADSTFAGNILLHPGYSNLGDWGDYEHSNEVLNKVFFIGAAPHYTEEVFEYIEKVLKDF